MPGGRLRSSSGLLPQSVGTQSSPKGRRGVAARGPDARRGTMSQRQVLQGRSHGKAPGPTGWRQGRATPFRLCPQCSSCTRTPGPGSCRWWRSRRPDLRTLRHCRMRVSLHRGPGLTPIPHPFSSFIALASSFIPQHPVPSLAWYPVLLLPPPPRCLPSLHALLLAQFLGIGGSGPKCCQVPPDSLPSAGSCGRGSGGGLVSFPSSPQSTS